MFASSGGLCTDHGKVTKKYRLPYTSNILLCMDQVSLD